MSNQSTDASTSDTTGETAFDTESHDPAVPEAYSAFMRTGWDDREVVVPRGAFADRTAERRARLAAMFPGERLVLPGGGYKVRSYDTDYRFRVDTAHAYFTGNQLSDAVLVIDDGESVLYARPRSGRDTDEFFRDRSYGQLWVGKRPSLGEMSSALGLPVRHIDRLPDALAGSGKTRVHRGVSLEVDRQVLADGALDTDFARVISEMRLVKDDWEVAQLQEACDITALGFEDCVREWDDVLRHGERWIEGTFFRRARAMGNDIGYDSIVGSGSHATTLHWIDNDGPVKSDDLILLDMGVEGRHLYTADVTRTLPVGGRYSPLQRDLYELVLQAQDAGIAACRPGLPFTGTHEAAMTVLAHGLGDLGLLPVSVEEALDPESKVYSRWTLHGTSHMLGLDVHDCGQAAPEAYKLAALEPGMVLTVEPGLYFQEDDLLVPEELRGIGIRIEDDILITADGARNLSASLPRSADDVEAWMGVHRR
ncbi:aminopeptidase P family protein [Nocardioides rubriscoriae]|uniref:aminopeptidase P family protein n=1 Tax=Nocardioides rubriscoriae TaxID=642762 RepID=UPI001FE91CB3|nr:aminopeptidase P family protein [Nocardioides rubriscoriae]